MSKSTRWPLGCVVVVLLSVITSAEKSKAAEVTVQNDSLADGATGNIQAGFAVGESAASWLTSPCDGNIVAIQIFWRSVTGTEPQSIEDSISIMEAGTFTFPSTVLETISGPVMTDGANNEFRFLDDMGAIPLLVPISNGQEFVVSLRFLNAPDPTNGPSIVTDTGCQVGKNAIDADGLGWFNACSLGVSGDFFIRAVIDCGSLTGACCEVGGGCSSVTSTTCAVSGGAFQGEGVSCGAVSCQEACCFGPASCLDLTVADCNLASGFNQGPGTLCGTTICFPTGACCNPDGTCDNDILDTDCVASGGVFQGDQVQCSAGLCPQPSGACCLISGGCLLLSETDCGVIPNSAWAGSQTDCTDANGSGIADDCEAPPPPVPTMSEWGALAMVLLLNIVGTLVFRRKRPDIHNA